MKLKYKLMLAIITIALGICLMTYQSYALWVASFTGGENIVNVGCFSVLFEELSSSISLNNTYPMSDTKGLTGTPYTFKITNTCSNDAKYEVTLNTLTTNGIPNEKMKYVFYTSKKPTEGQMISSLLINEDKTSINIQNLKDSFVLGSGVLAEDESITYHFNLWIDSSAGNEIMNQSFEASINVISAATKITAIDQIIKLASTSEELVYDETIDNNLRYIGANPNNYVSFNNELWRIIGVMNNIDDGKGNKASRLKIIRNEVYKIMVWDNESTNNWSIATSQIELNTTYYESMTDKTMIDNAVWNLGGPENYQDSSNGLTNRFYDYERGQIVYSGNPTIWKGRIGLMYPSDYGYATSGGASTNREACLNKELYNWHESSFSDCKNNDWLHKSDFFQWCITPMNTNAHNVFDLYQSGRIHGTVSTYTQRGIVPTLYLKPTVKITNGIGTSENPFILEM